MDVYRSLSPTTAKYTSFKKKNVEHHKIFPYTRLYFNSQKNVKGIKRNLFLYLRKSIKNPMERDEESETVKLLKRKPASRITDLLNDPDFYKTGGLIFQVEMILIGHLYAPFPFENPVTLTGEES